MSGTMIATSTTTGVVLTTASQNPVTVNNWVSVVSAVLDAIYGSSAAVTWTIGNAGTLQNTGSVANGGRASSD